MWLHFPKCGGVSVDAALRKAFAGRKDIHFDDIKNHSNVIWHQSIKQRGAEAANKRVICCIRRLPNWLLSRVHFEAERNPGYVATREMLLRGAFYENDGRINIEDAYATMYNNPPVSTWIRVENMNEDLAAAFGLDSVQVERDNKTALPYVKDLSFWFTPNDLRNLYDANPAWASIERQVYGSTLADNLP